MICHLLQLVNFKIGWLQLNVNVQVNSLRFLLLRECKCIHFATGLGSVYQKAHFGGRHFTMELEGHSQVKKNG